MVSGVKNSQKIILVSIGGVVIFLFVFLVIFVVKFYQDRKDTLQEMKKIQSEYNKFQKTIDSYILLRDKNNSLIFTDLYYDSLEEKNEINKSLFKEVENQIYYIEDNFQILKKGCQDTIYPDSNINIFCRDFSFIYEQLINCFVYDVEQYNQVIRDYNKLDENLGKEELNGYQTKYKYIDYNHDHVYDGKIDSHL